MLRFLTVPVCIFIVFGSCGDGGIKPDVAAEQGLFDNPDRVRCIEIIDPGAMHSEILVAFNREHRLGRGERMRTQDLARLIVRCTNASLASRHVDVRMTEKDFARMLCSFKLLKEKGVFDIERVTPESLVRLLDYSVAQGILEQSEADTYWRAITEIGRLRNPEQRNEILRKCCVTSNRARDAMFIDVLSNSYQFWMSAAKGVPIQSSILSGADTLGPDPDVLDFSDKWASYGTDALWTAISILMMPPSMGASIAGAIASMTASITMDVMWNDWMDWLNSQLNPPEG